MLDHNEAAEQEQVNEQDVFFKQLFDVFDSDKLGYITVDNFVNIFKQNIANDSLNDYKLNDVINSLDPNGLGRIDFRSFVNGMTKLYSDSEINDQNDEEFRNRRPTFTFENTEQTVDLLRLNYKNKQLNEYYDEDDENTNEKSNYDTNTTTNTTKSTNTTNITNITNITNANINNNSLEEIFENLNEDDNTHNSPTNKSSSNETDNYDFLDEINNSDSDSKLAGDETSEKSDIFGLDSNIINNHRKSLTATSSSTSIKRQQFLQKKKFNSLSFSAFEDVNDETSSSQLNEDLSKYETIVQSLENQIMNLTHENESLKSEINEQIYRNKSLNQENVCLNEKLQGIEEQLFEMERRNFFQIEEEKQKQQDLMNKMYAAQNDEQNNYLNQIKNFEIEIKKLKADQSVQLKYIDDIKKNLELKDNLLHKEELKCKKLIEQINEINTNMSNLEKENASQIETYDKKIKQLLIEQDSIQNELDTKETTLLAIKNNNLAVQNELNLRLKIDKLENENQTLKNEIESLNSNLEILNAQIYKNSNLDDSLFINFNNLQQRKQSEIKNETSLATEINTMSKEELLNKLVHEQQMSARLKDYIDDLVPKIIEYCPKIFEIKTVKRK